MSASFLHLRSIFRCVPRKIAETAIVRQNSPEFGRIRYIPVLYPPLGKYRAHNGGNQVQWMVVVKFSNLVDPLRLSRVVVDSFQREIVT